jgi:hypothetical protein
LFVFFQEREFFWRNTFSTIQTKSDVVFLERSSRKALVRVAINIPKRAAFLDDFEKDVRRTIFEFYNGWISNGEKK